MDEKIYIGKLDKRIGIYKETDVKDPSGAVIKTPVLYKNLWAKSTDVNENENEDGKIYLVQIRNYIIRYDSEILLNGEQMHIIDRDGTYYIAGIKSIGRNKYLDLKTVKRE